MQSVSLNCLSAIILAGNSTGFTIVTHLFIRRLSNTLWSATKTNVSVTQIIVYRLKMWIDRCYHKITIKLVKMFNCRRVHNCWKTYEAKINPKLIRFKSLITRLHEWNPCNNNFICYSIRIGLTGKCRYY